MSPRLIKWIDRRLGPPVCFTLTALRYLSLPFAPSRKREPKRILFLKLIEQGATVLAYPAIKRATEMVGRENVFFCVFGGNRPILDILDVIPPENIFTIREKNICLFFLDAVRFIFAARKRGIDAAADMEFFSRASAILAYLSGAAIRAGLHRFTSELPYRGNLFTHRLLYNPYLHTAKAYLLLTEALRYNPAETPMMKIPVAGLKAEAPVFSPSEPEKMKISAMLKQLLGGEPSHPIILLNPNASDMLPLRKWPEERFMDLAKRILSKIHTATVVITGAPSEKLRAEKICTSIGSPRAISMAGRTDLRELLVLYCLSDLLITNDSGPAHFASMTPVKTIVMFGPETPLLFGPLKSGEASIVWKELTCSPCVNAFNHRFSPCNDNVCMQSIETEEVFQKAMEMLNFKDMPSS